MLSVFKKSVYYQNYFIKPKGFGNGEVMCQSTLQGYETFHRTLDMKELNVGDKVTIDGKCVSVTQKEKVENVITYYTDQYSILQDTLSYIRAVNEYLDRIAGGRRTMQR